MTALGGCRGDGGGCARYSDRVSSPDRGCLRIARASAVAFCVVGLSLLAHVVAGGHPPEPMTLLLVTAAVAAYGGALTRDRLGLTELLVVLGAGQVLLHLVFMLGSGHHAGGPVMLAAHGLATIAIALGLAHGERAAWGLWCWLRPRLRLPRVERPEWPEPVACTAETDAARAGMAWVGTTVMWRGPPAH